MVMKLFISVRCCRLQAVFATVNANAPHYLFTHGQKTQFYPY